MRLTSRKSQARSEQKEISSPVSFGVAVTDELSVLLSESQDIRKAIEAIRAAIFSVFGIVLPALVSVFLITSDKLPALLAGKETVATLAVSLASLGTMWVQFLWMEYFRHIRYYYTQLLPRIYQVSDQGLRPNLLEWDILHRKTRHWLPLGLFNSSCSLILIATYWSLLRTSASLYAKGLCLALLLAAAASVAGVIMEVRSISMDVHRVKSKKPAA